MAGLGEDERDQAHHGSEEFGTNATSLTARAQDQREEKPEVTPHALPWGRSLCRGGTTA